VTAPPDDLVPIELVPVEVFGTACHCTDPACEHRDGGYGLSDAVSAWSDCNRAIGRIYRVEDFGAQPGQRWRHDPSPSREPGASCIVWVRRADLPWLERQHGEEFET
jgi:hypothetical protein